VNGDNLTHLPNKPYRILSLDGGGAKASEERGVTGPFPAEAFMVLDLVPGALADVRGTVRYPAAFGIM
jgi:hypothetical protein